VTQSVPHHQVAHYSTLFAAAASSLNEVLAPKGASIKYINIKHASHPCWPASRGAGGRVVEGPRGTALGKHSHG
jgi:hypothetical protein